MQHNCIIKVISYFEIFMYSFLKTLESKKPWMVRTSLMKDSSLPFNIWSFMNDSSLPFNIWFVDAEFVLNLVEEILFKSGDVLLQQT